MRHRSALSDEERQARSRLTKIMHQEPFIRGSIVKMNRSCGKANCWCAKNGKGHVSYYLALRLGSKRRMIYIPRKNEKKAREWVATYRQVSRGINEITKGCVKRLARG
jgi:intergrase/recombinase